MPGPSSACGSEHAVFSSVMDVYRLQQRERADEPVLKPERRNTLAALDARSVLNETGCACPIRLLGTAA
eukprot:scaffold188_cov429-Prasinococcus_capsulatus_cf.AAC.19